MFYVLFINFSSFKPDSENNTLLNTSCRPQTAKTGMGKMQWQCKRHLKRINVSSHFYFVLF